MDKAEQIVGRLSLEDAVSEKKDTVGPVVESEGNGFDKVPFHRELILFFLISTLAWAAITGVILLSMMEYTKRVQQSVQTQTERIDRMMGELDKRFTSLPDVTGKAMPTKIPDELKEGVQ